MICTPLMKKMLSSCFGCLNAKRRDEKKNVKQQGKRGKESACRDLEQKAFILEEDGEKEEKETREKFRIK